MRLLRSSSVTPNCARVGGSAGTERNSAAARCQLPRGKRTLRGAIGDRVRFVASAAVWLRLPLIDRRGHDGAVAAIGVKQKCAAAGGGKRARDRQVRHEHRERNAALPHRRMPNIGVDDRRNAGVLVTNQMLAHPKSS